jgi:hypothetical protein
MPTTSVRRPRGRPHALPALTSRECRATRGAAAAVAVLLDLAPYGVADVGRNLAPIPEAFGHRNDTRELAWDLSEAMGESTGRKPC